MRSRNNIKQRNKFIQGLRSFKDTLPKNIKRIIIKKGHIFSETLNNWKYLVGDDLFKISYPKSFKNSNKLGASYLLVMVKRGHEVDIEYSKKKILDKMNNYFGYSVVEKLKLISFDDDQTNFKKTKINHDVTNSKYMNKIVDIKNDKIKGVINLGSRDKISKGNLLFKIGKKLNLVKKNYVYENVENLNLKAFRPKNMLMCVKKIEKFLNKPMPKIDEGINDLISNIKINNKTGKLTNDF